MSARRKRIERILGHRQKQLDAAAASLARARTREAAAVVAAEAAREEAARAALARRALAERGSDAQTFLEAEDWLATTTLQEQRAWGTVARARAEVLQEQAAVLQARMKHKQAEQLALRLGQAEARLSARRDRRSEDEHAARIAHDRATQDDPG